MPTSTRIVIAERRWEVMKNPDLFKVTRGIDLDSGKRDVRL